MSGGPAVAFTRRDGTIRHFWPQEMIASDSRARTLAARLTCPTVGRARHDARRSEVWTGTPSLEYPA